MNKDVIFIRIVVSGYCFKGQKIIFIQGKNNNKIKKYMGAFIKGIHIFGNNILVSYIINLYKDYPFLLLHLPILFQSVLYNRNDVC